MTRFTHNFRKYHRGPLLYINCLILLKITVCLISDVLDVKLQKAKELGADYIVKTTKDMSEEDIVRIIKDTLKEEPHSSYDCCGVEMCARVAMHVS